MLNFSAIRFITPFLLISCSIGLLPVTHAQASPRSGDIRLSGGSCSGNLEIYLNAIPYGERWYQVCGRNLGDDEAEVICRQLGCPTEHAIRRQASFGFYALVYYVSQGYQCTGSESSLSSCRRVSGQCISDSVDYGDDNDHVAIRCRSSSPPSPPSPPTSSPTSSLPLLPTTGEGLCSSGSRCLGSSGYCSGSYYTGATCIGGYCRCPNVQDRDYCTCLAKIGSCHIQEGASTAVGNPTFESRSQTTYSCVANDNCMYDVHVVSNYEGNGHTGFRVHNTGRTNVRLRISGPNQGSKALVLVFVSYEPVNWILSIPSGVVIDRILLGSYYLDNSTVTGYSSQSVLHIEKLPHQTLPSGYGSDTGGGRTDQLLEYVFGRFGPVASFTGSYRADTWTLNIQRNLIQPGCQQPTLRTHPVNPDDQSMRPVTAIGDVRLSAGCSGELQVYEDLHNGEGWYSVCESGFSDADSQVVCRDLGCPVNGATSTMSTPLSSLPSLRAHFYCVGYESLVSQCRISLGQCSSTTSTVYVRCGTTAKHTGGAVMLNVSIITLVVSFILSLL